MKEQFNAQVVSMRRITIPDATAKVLDIKEGDFVRVCIEKIGSEKEVS